MTPTLLPVFGPDGYLAKRFSGYEPRAGQVALAEAVEESFRARTHLLAEAGTGTGKSIAYAVPAVHHALRKRECVVLVTANIALQEQLVRKDLPTLAEVLPEPFHFAIMKGRNNYICHDRLDQVRQSMEDGERFAEDSPESSILAWSERTEEGDVSELPFEPQPQIWRRFSVTSDECLEDDCAFQEECCANAARRRAADAHVIVTNYHMLFAHFVVADKTGLALVLPPFDTAVLDEGHKIAGIARDFFGWQFAEGAIEWAAKHLDFGGKARRCLDAEKRQFFASLLAYKRSGVYKIRLRHADVVPWRGLHGALIDAAGEYERRMKWLEEKAAEEGEGEMSSEDRREYVKLDKRRRRALSLGEQLERSMTFADPNEIYFIEEDGSRASEPRAVLRAVPVKVDGPLRRHLFGSGKATVVTSATLSVRGAFDYIASEIGAEGSRTLLAPSPFRWREQALLVTPADVPDPTDLGFAEAATDRFVEVVRQANGRTLGLFTSYRVMNMAYAKLIKERWRVLRQGEMPRTKLVDEFRRDVHSVLLGVESFWAGVDVVGESLSCVFIDRLPFATPEDPLLDALRERDSNWFMRYSVPAAIIAFKQGFGRLIRSTTDRGAVVVCDRRISTKGYGRLFIESLPPVARSERISDVGAFLGREAGASELSSLSVQVPVFGQTQPAPVSTGIAKSLFDL